MTSEQEIPFASEDVELAELEKLRREFHRYPEIRWTEFWTTARICNYLEDLGFEIIYGMELYNDKDGHYEQELRKSLPDEKIITEAFLNAMDNLGSTDKILEMEGGFTGVIGRMRCVMADSPDSNKVPKLGFRFDIDGLPILESSDPDHFPKREGFHSKNVNMHACGHDGHITIGLGLAKRISKNRASLKGEYYLVFQPGEEGGMGGLIFSNLEMLRNLDRFMALHIGLIEKRQIFCGVQFMASNQYTVEFRGRSTHAANSPNEGRNALLVACNAVMNLYGISRHSKGATRINVGEFYSNNAVNVIPDHVSFELQVRGVNSETSDYMTQNALRIIKAAAEMYDAEVEIREEGYYISTSSSLDLRKAIMRAAEKIGIPRGGIIDEVMAMGSEDAAFIMREVQMNGGQAAFICMGSNTRGGHHNPMFDFDEDLLIWGVDLLWELAKEPSTG